MLRLIKSLTELTLWLSVGFVVGLPVIVTAGLPVALAPILGLAMLGLACG